MMGFYDNYRARMECGKSISDKLKDEIADSIRDSFFNLPNVEKVYLNGIPTEVYDVIINKGDKSKNSLGYKTLLSYPYDEIKFSLGDYVYWTYNVDETIWILLSLDDIYYYDVKGKMYRCNDTLKVEVDSTNTIIGYDSLNRPIVTSVPIYFEAPCFYITKNSNAENSDLSHAINIPQGNILLYYQYDANSKVEVGMKFEIKGMEYIITSFDTSNVIDDSGYIIIIGKEVTLYEDA